MNSGDQDELKLAFKMFDENDDKKLSKEEFITLMSKTFYKQCDDISMEFQIGRGETIRVRIANGCRILKNDKFCISKLFLYQYI